MGFTQMIEFEGSKEDFESRMARFKELTGDESTVRRVVLLADRERPGCLIELVEFDSWEDACKNSELPGTKQAAAEAGFAEAKFRNLDVLATYDIA